MLAQREKLSSQAFAAEYVPRGRKAATLATLMIRPDWRAEHALQGGVGELHGGFDVELEVLLLLGNVVLLEGLQQADPGIVDQDLHRPGGIGEPGDDGGNPGVVGQVGGDRLGAAPYLFSSSAAVAARRAASRATSTTLWPCSASWRANSAPMPAVAPVIESGGARRGRCVWVHSDSLTRAPAQAKAVSGASSSSAGPSPSARWRFCSSSAASSYQVCAPNEGLLVSRWRYRASASRHSAASDRARTVAAGSRVSSKYSESASPSMVSRSHRAAGFPRPADYWLPPARSPARIDPPEQSGAPTASRGGVRQRRAPSRPPRTSASAPTCSRQIGSSAGSARVTRNGTAAPAVPGVRRRGKCSGRRAGADEGPAALPGPDGTSHGGR